jgi:hypothetical protein
MLTLPAILISFFLKDFYQSLREHWKPILGLYIVGFLPYAIGNQEVDLIGPRQFAMSGFFLFIIIYHSIIHKIFINLKINASRT